MSVFPNIVREYFQNVFLAKLYTLSEAEKMLFKGGTALRILYGSPRFSEDLDFSLSGRSIAAAKAARRFLSKEAQTLAIKCPKGYPYPNILWQRI